MRAADAAAYRADHNADRFPLVLQTVQTGVNREYEPEPEP